ncbi:HlyD family secretion protein [Cupriavidus necator]|uniref:HlyD family secretion protein n=1 Tax=Cupriavidus necator TaxID=106590 RepID=UPI0005B37C3B|nr:multidrug transporter [Cupriavidus necator]
MADQRNNPPPRQHLLTPAPAARQSQGEGLVERKQPVAVPLWHIVPRMAGYGVVLFIVWAVLTIMFPNVFTRSSERAVVNSPVSLVTSPVEGIVMRQMIAAGQPFTANQPLMVVQNPNIDRSLLVELTGKKLDNQQRHDSAKAKLESNRRLLAATEQDLQRYNSAAQREHASRVRALEARLAAAKAQEDQQEEVVNRNQNMQWAGAVSEAYTNASRYQLSMLSNAKAAAKAELDNAVGESEASRNKVYTSSTDSPSAALAQRRQVLNAESAQLTAELEQLEEYGKSVDQLLATEQERIDRLSNLEIRLTEPGTVEDLIAQPGMRVAAGATLARASNCAQTRVVAVFPRSLSDSLLPGARLNVHVDGLPAALPASVAEILPRAPDGDQARYFVPFPPIEKNEIYVIAKLDRPLDKLPGKASASGVVSAANASVPQASSGHCGMGRWARVTLNQSWLGQLRASLS